MARIPNPKFNLRAPQSKNETLIFLVYRYRGKRLLHSTGFSIHPSDWDFKKQRPIEKERRPDLWAIREQIDDLSSYCKSIYIEANYGAIDVLEFKEKLELKANPPEPGPEIRKLSFFDFVKEELAEMKAHGMRLSSYKPFKLHAGILKEFAQERGRFTYEDVDWNFRLELIDWLAGRNAQVAYGNKTLSILRQFLERARRKKYHSNTDYHGSGWMIPRKKAEGQKVILTPEELEVLYRLKLSGLKDTVRDLFLIGAGTGQRFSDYSRYTPSHFYRTPSGAPLLSVISQKTDMPAKIPLNLFPWLIPTLEKCEYKSPKVSMQKFNMHIKEICEQAGISEEVLKVEQYMGRKAVVEKIFVPKHTLVSSHTCRRSFATNLYLMGYKLAQIMPMTGHSTEAQLRQYIGIDAEENAEAIALNIQKQQRKES